MFVILIILSVLAAIFGMAAISEATFGVGIIGLALLLAVFARLAQADAAQKETVAMLKAIDELTYKAVHGADAKRERQSSKARAAGAQAREVLDGVAARRRERGGS